MPNTVKMTSNDVKNDDPEGVGLLVSWFDAILQVSTLRLLGKAYLVQPNFAITQPLAPRVPTDAKKPKTISQKPESCSRMN